jgi:hypothetical protein
MNYYFKKKQMVRWDERWPAKMEEKGGAEGVCEICDSRGAF